MLSTQATTSGMCSSTPHSITHPNGRPSRPVSKYSPALGLVELGFDVAVGAQEAGEVELLGLDVAQDDLVAVEREAEPDLPEPAAEVEHPDRSRPPSRSRRSATSS